MILDPEIGNIYYFKPDTNSLNIKSINSISTSLKNELFGLHSKDTRPPMYV